MELSLRSPRIASSSIRYGPFVSVRYILSIHRIDASPRYIESIYASTEDRARGRDDGGTMASMTSTRRGPTPNPRGPRWDRLAGVAIAIAATLAMAGFEPAFGAQPAR